MLIFPEGYIVAIFYTYNKYYYLTVAFDVIRTGTCINNTSVFMFKKGSFEIGGTIHPAAIKVFNRF